MECKWCKIGETYHFPWGCSTPCTDGGKHTVNVVNRIGSWIKWQCDTCQKIWQDDSSG